MKRLILGTLLLFCQFGLAFSNESRLSQRVFESFPAVVPFEGKGSVHRHFGDIVVGRRGTVIGAHRKASEHGVKGGGGIVYYTSNDRGRTFSRERVLAPATPGRDKRDVAMGISSTGRVVVVWTDTAEQGATGPTHFQSTFSDDEGASWSTPRTFATIPYSYARAYGTVKSIDRPQGRSMLAVPAYFRTNDDPDYKVAMYFSHDDGESWVEGEPVHYHDKGKSDAAYTETDHAWIDPANGFAVSRSGSGMPLFRTTNGGTTWKQTGRVSEKNEDAVAPAIYIVNADGRKFLFVFYCDRKSNTTRVRWAPLVALLKDDISEFARNMRVLSPADMVNASGYQKVGFFPDGTALMVEFREKSGGDRSSDVRFVRLAPRQWVKPLGSMERSGRGGSR